MIEIIKKIMTLVEQISRELDYPLTFNDYYIEDLSCPHKPPRLPKNKCAVYMFFYENEAIKIGKANQKTAARFSYQHYGFNAMSTLAKSLIKDPYFVNLGVTVDNAGDWIKNNMRRINILINADRGPAATELIEAIFHYKFRPRYEGALNNNSILTLK